MPPAPMSPTRIFPLLLFMVLFVSVRSRKWLAGGGCGDPVVDRATGRGGRVRGLHQAGELDRGGGVLVGARAGADGGEPLLERHRDRGGRVRLDPLLRVEGLPLAEESE